MILHTLTRKTAAFKIHILQFRLNYDPFWNEIVRTLPNDLPVQRNRMELMNGEKIHLQETFSWNSLCQGNEHFCPIYWHTKVETFSLLDQNRFTRFKTEFLGTSRVWVVVHSDPEFSRSVCELHEYIRTQEIHDVPSNFQPQQIDFGHTGNCIFKRKSFSELKRVKLICGILRARKRCGPYLSSTENRLLD